MVGGQRRTNLVWAIVLVVAFALRALQAGPDLSTDADTVALLDGLDLGADLDGLADDLVADADGQRCTTPAAVDCVNIATADTAALDLDVDVVVAEDLGFELEQSVWALLALAWEHILLPS